MTMRSSSAIPVASFIVTCSPYDVEAREPVIVTRSLSAFVRSGVAPCVHDRYGVRSPRSSSPAGHSSCSPGSNLSASPSWHGRDPRSTVLYRALLASFPRQRRKPY